MKLQALVVFIETITYLQESLLVVIFRHGFFIFTADNLLNIFNFFILEI